MIDQEELINAVGRINVPEETIKELKAIYNIIWLRIKDGEGYSFPKENRTRALDKDARYHRTFS